MKKSISNLIGIIVFIILLWADQFTKHLAVTRLKDHGPIILIDKVFQLLYLENRGAAFGILQGQRVIFLIITVIVMLLIIYCYVRIPYAAKYRWLRVIMVMIAAGAVGNMIDRAANAFVVDFFYFNLIDFPIFNVADIYVTCGACLLILVVLFRYKDEEITDVVNSLKISKK